MELKPPVIQVTNDYDKFKDIKGNRPHSQPHIREVARSIEVKDLTPWLPIIVNENFEIIDGQHRFESCRMQHKPVFYIVAKGLRLPDVQMLNSTSRRWLLQDYIDSHIELGNQEYVKLKDFMTRHGLSAGISITLLTGNHSGNVRGGTSQNKAVRDGYFKASNEESAELIANVIDDLNKYCDFDANKERGFVGALVGLMGTDSFNIDRFKLKLQDGQRVALQPSPRHYVLEIERIYNFHAKHVVDLFTGASKNAYMTPTK